MTIRCPACAERLEYHAHELPAGGDAVCCRSCGHDWLEGKATEVSAEPIRPVLTFERSSIPDGDIHHLVSASLQAQEIFELKRQRRRVGMAAWVALVLLALTPAAVTVAMPERVVAAAPATISLYDWLGREINIYGLEIQKVELQHIQTGGQRLIAIKGEVVNVSRSDQKIPWLRFGLKSDEDIEVYQWKLDTESRPLRPGESKSFLTRIASPPQTASLVEIRFARTDEIGSNTRP